MSWQNKYILLFFGIILSFSVFSQTKEELKKQKSNIHGIGVFASKNLIKDEFIGIAGLNNLFKTTLGRWINHSNKNNARFFFTKNLDVLVFATKNIKINTEIVANYRDHILNPKIINIKTK